MKGINRISDQAWPSIRTGALLVATLTTAVALLILAQNPGMIGHDVGLTAVFSVSVTCAVTAAALTTVATLRLRPPLAAQDPDVQREPSPEEAPAAPSVPHVSQDTVANVLPPPFEEAVIQIVEEEPSPLQAPELLPIPAARRESGPTPIRIAADPKARISLTQEEFNAHIEYYKLLTLEFSNALLNYHPGHRGIFSSQRIEELIQPQTTAFQALETRLQNDAHFIAWLALDTLRARYTKFPAYDTEQQDCPKQFTQQELQEFSTQITAKHPLAQSIIDVFGNAKTTTLETIANRISLTDEALSSFLRALAIENITMHITSLWLSINHTTYNNEDPGQINFFFGKANVLNEDKWNTFRAWNIGKNTATKKREEGIKRRQSTPLGQCQQLPAHLVPPPVFYVHLTHPDSTIRQALREMYPTNRVLASFDDGIPDHVILEHVTLSLKDIKQFTDSARPSSIQALSRFEVVE